MAAKKMKMPMKPMMYARGGKAKAGFKDNPKDSAAKERAERKAGKKT